MSSSLSTGLLPELAACRDGLWEFKEALDPGTSKVTGEGMAAAWSRYYAGAFARFESRLIADQESEPAVVERLVPVAISHHNLHRLVEVLALELGSRPLAETRAAERLVDLAAMVQRLGELLEEFVAGAPASAAVRKGEAK